MPKMLQPEGFEKLFAGYTEYTPTESGVIDVLPEHVEIAKVAGFKVIEETAKPSEESHE